MMRWVSTWTRERAGWAMHASLLRGTIHRAVRLRKGRRSERGRGLAGVRFGCGTVLNAGACHADFAADRSGGGGVLSNDSGHGRGVRLRQRWAALQGVQSHAKRVHGSRNKNLDHSGKTAKWRRISSKASAAAD